MKAKLRVEQIKTSPKRVHALTVRGLGLKGPGSSVVVANTPSFRGAIKKVIHLVKVEEVDA